MLRSDLHCSGPGVYQLHCLRLCVSIGHQRPLSTAAKDAKLWNNNWRRHNDNYKRRDSRGRDRDKDDYPSVSWNHCRRTSRVFVLCELCAPHSWSNKFSHGRNIYRNDSTERDANQWNTKWVFTETLMSAIDMFYWTYSYKLKKVLNKEFSLQGKV